MPEGTGHMGKRITLAMAIIVAVAGLAAAHDGNTPVSLHIRSGTVELSPDPITLTAVEASSEAQLIAWYAGITHDDLERLAYLDAVHAANVEAERAAAAAVVAPPRPVAVAPAPVAATSWPASLYPCGGDLPPCYVKQRESGGDYNARNPSSSASGAWQFLDSTWAGFGGYSRAYLAPPDVQDARARELWAGGAGCGHWSAC